MTWAEQVLKRRFLLPLAFLLTVALHQQPSAVARPAPQEPPDLSEYNIYLPHLASLPSRVRIAAAHIDSVRSGEADEAILLWNLGPGTQELAGWQIAAGSRTAAFPATSTETPSETSALHLEPGERLWCTAQATAFRTSFGEEPGCVWNEPDVPAPIHLEGTLTLRNAGGRILLADDAGNTVDTLLYGDESRPAEGWIGLPAQLYTRGEVKAAGQIWQRKQDPLSGLPIDTDRASDWAGDLGDLEWGRRVRRAGWMGWDHSDLARPAHIQSVASLTLAVGPEGLYTPIAAAIDSATTSIDLSIYTLEHPDLAQRLAAAAQRGVRVRLLLEGAPPGGITNLQRWSVAHVAAGGGEVAYLAVIDGAPNGYEPRYRYTHAKYGILDGRTVLVGTENFSVVSMPVPTGEPLGGRRGYYLIVESPPLAEAFARIFAADWSPDRFLDLHPYTPEHPRYGDPPAAYAPPAPPSWHVTGAPFSQPIHVQGPMRFVLVSAPENNLRPDDGLHALIQRAGPGDEILVEQLYEHVNWGDTTSNPIADPNPRLRLLIEAARRGARVRVLLDSYFDDAQAARNNRATVNYLNTLAATEGLDLEAATGNPTRAGLHAKLYLLRVGGETWSAVGSLNGGEVSHKLNREVLLLVDAPAVHSRIAEVFAWDWALGTP